MGPVACFVETRIFPAMSNDDMARLAKHFGANRFPHCLRVGTVDAVAAARGLQAQTVQYLISDVPSMRCNGRRTGHGNCVCAWYRRRRRLCAASCFPPITSSSTCLRATMRP